MWIIFFFIARLIFLLFNWTETSNAGWTNAFGSLFNGMRMDMSMSVYLIAPILIFVLLSNWIAFFQKKTIYIIYTSVVLFIVLLLVCIDLGLFPAWHSRVDATFLRYVSNPKEVWATISHLPIYIIIPAFFVAYFLMLWLFRKTFASTIHLLKNNKPWLQFAFVILLGGVMILPLRGGFQLAPMNQSTVFFSENHFSNLAALNAPWNFMHDVMHRADESINPFATMSEEEAEAIKNKLYTVDSIAIHTNAKPNVLLIVWESLTAKVVNQSFKGKEITPGLNALLKEGIYFSNAYATGDRTDKGIVGVLSGFPAQPTTSIVKIPAKAARLPMISKDVKQVGYHTAYYYGGELEFANMKAYLMQGGFDKFTAVDAFDAKDKNSKWGAHDGVVANRLYQDLQKVDTPFFYTWLTLSSHEPFETPNAPVLDVSTDEGKFLNVMHYSDSIVYSFIQKCKQLPWWKNTIVVIVGDHGHPLPKTEFRADNFRVPMFISGGYIQEQKQITDVVSQNDLAATVLHLLNLPHDNYKWSKNLFASKNHHAFFTFNNGYGYADSSSVYLFDNVGKRLIEQQGAINDEQIKTGSALQQLTYRDFLQQ